MMTMKTTSLADMKAHLSAYVDEANRTQERITITRNGIPAAVLISVDDLEGLEETVVWLADHERVAEVAKADANEDYVTGDEMARLMRERQA
jgi:antitoxin YefM